MTVDALSFVGVSRFGYRRSAAEAIEAMDAEGITMAAVAPMHPVDGDLARANRELADAVRAGAGRLVGLARVDPWDGADALAQLTHAVTEDDVRGVFLHPAEEHFRINDERLRPIAERAAELGVPVLVATGFPWRSEAVQVARFAEWCPDTPVVLTTGGQLNISGMGLFDAHQAMAAPTVHILTSGVYRDDYLHRTIDRFGADRLLFASYAPICDVRYEHRRVGVIDAAEPDRRLITAGNAERLFHLT